MPPFAKAPASLGGHYGAPDFILVLNITNKGGSCVIKQRRLCAEEAAGKLKSERVNPGNAAGSLAAVLPSYSAAPTLMFVLQPKTRLAGVDTFRTG